MRCFSLISTFTQVMTYFASWIWFLVTLNAYSFKCPSFYSHVVNDPLMLDSVTVNKSTNCQRLKHNPNPKMIQGNWTNDWILLKEQVIFLVIKDIQICLQHIYVFFPISEEYRKEDAVKKIPNPAAVKVLITATGHCSACTHCLLHSSASWVQLQKVSNPQQCRIATPPQFRMLICPICREYQLAAETQLMPAPCHLQGLWKGWTSSPPPQKEVW